MKQMIYGATVQLKDGSHIINQYESTEFKQDLKSLNQPAIAR